MPGVARFDATERDVYYCRRTVSRCVGDGRPRIAGEAPNTIAAKTHAESPALGRLRVVFAEPAPNGRLSESRRGSAGRARTRLRVTATTR